VPVRVSQSVVSYFLDRGLDIGGGMPLIYAAVFGGRINPTI
jgi:hypothetical protein